MFRFSLVVIFSLFSLGSYSQDELLSLLDDQEEGDQFVSATFKSTRLMNGHSVEIRTPKVLEFVINHRFGRVDDGAYGFWGLDGANIRLGLEYGLIKNLNVGIGRSSFGKTFDSFAKYRLLRQSNKVPVTITGFGSWTFVSDSTISVTKRSHRSTYTGQILIARKFNSKLSLQIMPTLIQRNLVPTVNDENGLVAIGFGGRYKVSNRMSVNMEYYPQITDYSDQRFDSFAIGIDIETGGHVFQLLFTNAIQMNEKGFIGETSDDFWGKGVHFGFNISRVFDLGRNKKNW